MEINSVMFSKLLMDTKDGDWGKGEAYQGFLPYRVIRGTDFADASSGNLSNIPIRYLAESSVHRRTLQADDIIIETAGGSNDRPTGRTFLIKRKLIEDSELPLTCASFCRFLRVNPDLANPRYVYWYLQYLYAKGEMWIHQVKHTGIARFQYTRFASTVQVPLPSKDEQQAIAHILGSLDDKIELNRQMNETLEGIARALFQSWFVDFDPVRAKMAGRQPYSMDAETAALFPDGFEDSVLGEIPRGWNIKSLDQIATFLNGLALQKYPPVDNNYLPVIKIAELRKGITENSDHASASIEKKYIVDDGDVLFSWSGSLDVVIWCQGKGALNQHLFKVTSDKYPKWFYYHWILHYLPAFQAIAAGKATTMGHIQRHHLTAAYTLIPEEHVFQKMHQIMAPIHNLTISRKLENNTLITLRDTLLPKLLSGELRVGEAEKEVGAIL